MVDQLRVCFAMQKGDALLLMIDQLRISRCRRILQRTMERIHSVSPSPAVAFILKAKKRNVGLRRLLPGVIFRL